VNAIVVTGSNGFIGKAVVAELGERGIPAVGFDAPSTIMSPDQLRSAVEESGADGIINLAGVLGTAETIGAERQAAEVNILGALQVMDVAARYGIPLVQIATGHEGQPNPYAITKRCATDLALARAMWTGQEINVVRAFHVYGPGQKLFPPHGTSAVRKIIPSFVARALTGMPIQINGDGEQEIDLVWVGDVARVLVRALDFPYGRLLEAGTGKATTVRQAALDVIRVCGSTSDVEHVVMRAGEPEGTRVVAGEGVCPNPWPYRLAETVAGYRAQVLR
jgi:UDP-glucose 4-epimerase